MRDLPGRKSVVYVTSGFAFVTKDPNRSRHFREELLEAFRHLVDESNRSFVTIHTLDARGLANPVGKAFAVTSSGDMEISALEEKYTDSQAGPMLLAEQAGGFSFATNDFNGALGKALADQEGYYVLGYHPDSGTFTHDGRKPAAFHRITVNVKRPGLHVRTRAGFFGMTDEEAHPEPRTPEDRLWTLARSPFIASSLGVHATPLFTHRKNGDVFRILLHLDGEGLTFAKSEDGLSRAPVELLATLIDRRGAPVTQRILRFDVKSPREPDAARRAAGFGGEIELATKDPGAYQLRVVVRDVGSNRSGSAYQFVQVPNLSKAQLAISGVLLEAITNANANADPATSGMAANAGGPAVRRFRASSTVRYAFDAYNVRNDPTSGRPALTVRTRIYRDGALVVDGPATPIAAQPHADAKPSEAAVAGVLQLPTTLPPAQYQLQIDVTDTRARPRRNTARQWIEFTVTAPQ
jgi:hypothetical protein